MNWKSRELLLTDYLDGQMDAKENGQIETHLAHCPKCREFLVSARKVGPELFIKSGTANPPEYLWRRVKETILTEQKAKARFTDNILERVRAFLYTARYSIRPALVAASIIVLILAVTAVAGLKMAGEAENRYKDQIEYFDYLAGSSGGASTSDNAGFGTSVETYFL